MPRLALELDDRTLALARDGVVLATLPAVAFDGTGGEPAGASAWNAQRRTPTHVSSRYIAELAEGSSPADIVPTTAAAQLAAHLAPYREIASEFWIAVPAAFKPAGLSSVLAILRQLGFRIAGFVDAAAAVAGVLAAGRNALVVEIGLHHVGVTAVESGAHSRRRRAVVSARGGLLEIYESWLDLVRAAMVKQTRFDPLHDAATDQRVFDSLAGLGLQAAESGSATATIEAGTERYEVALSRDQFERAGEPVYREIMRLLRDLRHAGAEVTIIAPRLIFDLPGLRRALDSFRNCELITVPDGFAAAAASLLELPAAEGADPDAARLIRRVPTARLAALEPLATGTLLGADAGQDAAPSHILYEGRAIALDRGPVTIGRGAEGTAVIALPEGLAGVSRRHCTFVHEGDYLVLVDHSAHGTYVNGERVVERIRMQAGDRVRIGEPGVELALIAVGA
jgi:hypothetical protein